MAKKFIGYFERKWDSLPRPLQKAIKVLFFGRAFRGIIIYILASIFAELQYLPIADQQDNVYSYLVDTQGSIVASIIWWVLGLWLSGFSGWSVAVKIFFVLFFGILHYFLHRTTAVIELYINWQGWKPHKKWFERVNSDLGSRDIQSRFSHQLYVNLDHVERNLLSQLLPNSSLTNSQVEFEHFMKVLPDLKEFNYTVDTTTTYRAILDELRYLSDLDSFIRDIVDVRNQLQQSIQRRDWQRFYSLSHHELFAYAEKLSKKHEIATHLLRDKQLQETRKEKYFRTELFGKIDYVFTSIEHHKDALHYLTSNHQFLHGDAGMGKTNISAHLAEHLIDKGSPVIFSQGKKFNGNPENLALNLRMAWEIDGRYTVEEILAKLNKRAKRKKQRMLIIIDGLNETRYNIGFSRIWEKHIEEILDTAKKYQHLFFLFTLRTSYIGRIWTESPPTKLLQIHGFNSEAVTKEAVEKYSNHYGFQVTNLDTANVSFFRNPLMLDLFCKMISKNASRTITLETTTYLKVFDDYINKLMVKVQRDLEKPHPSLVHEALDRSSEAFLREPRAELPVNTFYEAVDNVSRDKIVTSTSTADRFLDGQLIFILDNLQSDNSDVVRHTQQQIGGYLLAKFLTNRYPNVTAFSASTEFTDYLKGSVPDADTGYRNTNAHQLAYDILTFLVHLYAQRGEHLFEMSDDQAVIDLSLEYLSGQVLLNQREEDILKHKQLVLKTLLDRNDRQRKGWSKILETTVENLVSDSEAANIEYLHDRLLQLNSFLLDLTLGNFLYNNAAYLLNIFSEGGFSNIGSRESSVNIRLFYLLAVWSLETTVTTIRDKATLVLLQGGVKQIDFIFGHLQQFAPTKHIYVYERLALIAYGISLRNQHDEEFVQTKLSRLAGLVYELQFAEKPTAPSFNYIVVDSFKHIIDLAIANDAFELGEAEMERLSKYKFTPPFQWSEVSDQDLDKVNPVVRDWHQDVDPFKGDFVHYTIPRLIRDRGPEGKSTAHIYRRLHELGYEELDFDQPQNQILQKFFQGHSIYGIEGKVDRLGKKYSWMAFFDYAGFLLNTGELDVWDDEEGKQSYTRLSDVGIDPSMPNGKRRSEKIFPTDLFGHRSDNAGWTRKSMYHTVKDLIKFSEGDREFNLLHGMVEKREADNYDLGSYMLIEAFLVNNEDIHENFSKIQGKEFDWRDDFNSHSSISYVYFGELYWADNTVETGPYYKDLPSGEKVKIEKPSAKTWEKLSWLERRQIEKQVEQGAEEEERLAFKVESAYTDYQWENQSEVFSGLGLTIPSTNIGKHLNLKADPQSLTILDEAKGQATIHFSFEGQEGGQKEEQKLSYLRSDLLDRYIRDKGYTLVYQIKQHTYDRNAGDGTGDFRGMQFFTPDYLKTLKEPNQ